MWSTLLWSLNFCYLALCLQNKLRIAMMKSLKNIMHSSRAVLALNGTLMIVLVGLSGSCQSSSHSQCSQKFWKMKLQLKLRLLSEKKWVLAVCLSVSSCFPVRTVQNILLKGYFFPPPLVFFWCLGPYYMYGCLNRQTSLYSCCFFLVSYHWYHFL